MSAPRPTAMPRASAGPVAGYLPRPIVMSTVGMAETVQPVPSRRSGPTRRRVGELAGVDIVHVRAEQAGGAERVDRAAQAGHVGVDGDRQAKVAGERAGSPLEDAMLPKCRRAWPGLVPVLGSIGPS